MDPICPPLDEVINFLAKLFDEGKTYSVLCSVRSALSCYIHVEGYTESFGNIPVVRRFMKGVFEKRPSLTRKSKVATWDVNIVLNFLESWVPLNTLTLKELTLKLTMLLALLSGQRRQTLHKLDINNIKLTDQKCILFINSILKHTRVGVHQKPVELVAFDANPSLCIVRIMKEYLSRTKDYRRVNHTTNLLLSFQKPFRPVSRDTISRWIKIVLDLSGIDITSFTAHSTRAASTSAAAEKGLPFSVILDAAGWSQEGTFTRFYRKNVTKNYSQCILDQFMPRNDNTN